MLEGRNGRDQYGIADEDVVGLREQFKRRAGQGAQEHPVPLASPTVDDVAAAFDSIGGQVVMPMALKFTLEKRGFDLFVAADAINRAIADGVLGQTPAGGIFQKTKI